MHLVHEILRQGCKVVQWVITTKPLQKIVVHLVVTALQVMKVQPHWGMAQKLTESIVFLWVKQGQKNKLPMLQHQIWILMQPIKNMWMMQQILL